jgi:hypothetical protein
VAYRHLKVAPGGRLEIAVEVTMGIANVLFVMRS